MTVLPFNQNSNQTHVILTM